jgi:hypothetical protein
MKKLHSLLSLLVAGVGSHGILIEAHAQVSVSGSHADRSQVHWAGVNNDLITTGSATLLSVTADPSAQQAALINGSTSATTGGLTMYNDLASYSVTFTLNTATNTLGYDIIAIDTYAGWTKWRVNQLYDVSYTTVSSATPVPLTSVNYLPVTNGVPAVNDMSTRVHITNPRDILARGVKTITFTFRGDPTQPATGFPNIGAMYREIDVHGHPTLPAVSRTLVSGGSSSYVIALPASPSAAVTNAAQQLQSTIHQISACTIPIASAASLPPGTDRILVGKSPEIDALLPGMDWPYLGEDGMVVRTVGDDLILAGNGNRGTLYAVFEFLERQLGCRWWTATEKSIPTLSTITVPNLNITQVPTFRYRSYYSPDTMTDQAFATIMRQNGTFQPQTATWGSHHTIMGSVHTHFYLVPPSAHFATHPEWYTDPNTGLPCTSSSPMPDHTNSQLNLSAPGLAAAVAAEAINWIAANPTAGYISITENDNSNYCQCSACVSLRTTEGSQAGPNLQFVNQVAAIIHGTYPGFKVETLAYRDCLHAPATLVPGPDVIVRFAPLQANFGHPLNDHSWNGPTPPGSVAGQYQEDAYNNLPNWAEISTELLVWNYITNFNYVMLPYPNYHILADDLRFFAQNKVTGVFEQGDNYTGGVGDFVQLRAWVVGKLLWDPLIDQDVYTNEFLTGYYGAAAPHLSDYLDLVRASYLTTGRKLLADEADFSYMDLATMTAGKTLFDQAEAAVSGDATKLLRVQRERIAFDLMWLYRYNPLRQAANFTSTTFGGPSAPLAELASLDSAATGYGVLQYREDFTGGGYFSIEEVPRLEDKLTANLTTDQPLALPASILALIPSGTAAENLIVLHPHDLKIRLQRFGEIIADTLSPSGLAVRMPGTLTEWGPQYDMRQYEASFYNNDYWDMYAEVRVDPASGASGDVFEGGVYDIPQYFVLGTGNVFHSRIPYATLSDGQYHIVRLGSASKKIPRTSFLWLTAGNPAIPYVYVNRVFFVRR